MRATLRITWFLLSLSFLFDSICSDDTQTNTPMTQTITTAAPVNAASAPSLLGASSPTVQAAAPVSAASAPSLLGASSPTVQTAAPVSNVSVSNVPVSNVPVSNVSVTDKAADASTAAKTSVNTNQHAVTTQKTINSPNPPTAVMAFGPVTAATATAKPTPTQPQTVVVVASNPPPTTAHPTSGAPPVVVHGSAVTSAASSVANTVTPSAKVSIGSPTRPSTVKTPDPAATTKIPEVSTKLPLEPSSNGASVTTKGTSNSQTTEDGRGSHTLFTPTVSLADNKAGTKETLPTSQRPTPFRTTIPEATPTLDNQTRQPEPIDTTLRTSPPQTPSTPSTPSTATSASSKKFIYSLLSEQATKEEEDLAQVCKLLMPNWLNGTCALTWRHHNGKVEFDLVEINGKVKTSQAAQYYEEITKKPTDNRTLIAILASCGALLIMIVILAVCASHHRKPYHENQQHLTEELHTVENGYHDNPTLEVMEVQPEMQEKKVALNGEFNDSWIVPMDNLLKEDLPDEEDTHL